MDKQTKIFHGTKGSKRTLPLNGRFGFCPQMVVEEDCLVIVPAPEDKHAIIVSDNILKGLGYYHFDQTTYEKVSTLLQSIESVE